MLRRRSRILEGGVDDEAAVYNTVVNWSMERG
jgi:hypothetical protein